jgi:hypothetical protein
MEPSTVNMCCAHQLMWIDESAISAKSGQGKETKNCIPSLKREGNGLPEQRELEPTRRMAADSDTPARRLEPG